MFIQTNQLNQKQLAELNGLVKACLAVDGYTIPIYRQILTQNRQRPGTLLYYQHERLVGFISIYFFYEQACEIAIMVHPDYRRKKIATRLLSSLLPLMLTKEIKSLLFSSLPDYHRWLSALGLTYTASEYDMIRRSSDKIIITSPRLYIKKATFNELAFICAADEACFQEHNPNMSQRAAQLIKDRHYRLLVASLDGKYIGKAHIHWQSNGAHLSDIAVLPEFQGQGLGYEIIADCINYILDANKSTILLAVQTKNKQAIKLYTRLGFDIDNLYDYWEIKADALLQHLIDASS